ncbi:hypothetical protein ILUMI_18011 [Ignelater luminosus]|uniref:Putative alpha-L-fucosidase n=1 Tax=Ignelater luminosus TaxID=2038154 RepID=A0A8K0CNF9_IGNLU|nr:hypothetical protein ILUMI_18011 [Ignelater luminosus]
MSSLKIILVICILYNVVAMGNRIRYEPNWESLDTRPLPQWYDDAKFGIFLHWGVYSVPSFGSEWFWKSWKGKFVVITVLILNLNLNYVLFMLKNYPPGFTYQEFAKDFKAEFFNPNAWADLFKKSGAKYVVLTSKHHEGYTLWPSSYSFSWNAKDVGPHRDLVGDLAKAIRKRTDLKFGLYHSLYEWYNPRWVADKKSNFQNNTFAVNKVIPELLDIVNTYHPEIVWSDGDWEAPDTYWKSTDFLAWLYNESPVKNNVVVNDRWGIGTSCKHGDFYNCVDRFVPGEVLPHKWENAMTIDKHSWGYRRNSRLKDYFTTHELLVTMARTISYGGNLLMNVGPTSDGRITPIFEERLLDMGEWLSINGDGIYGTKPWIHQNETNINVWYTAKDPAVYAIVSFWPNGNLLELKMVRDLFENEAAVVTLLGHSGQLKWETSGDSVKFHFPDKATVKSRWAWVLKIEVNTFKYEPTWESLDTRPLPQWYDDAKFGIFLHWGVYSVPSFGSEWFWKSWKGKFIVFIILVLNGRLRYVLFMLKNYPPGFTYQEFAKDFKAEFFDPNAWADLFKKSGAKYVVLTSKHHEGFTLWPSSYSFSWNAKDVGPHRDLVGDLANAVRKRTDLKFGLYHSLFEWFNPRYVADKKSNFQNNTFAVNKAIPELLDIVNTYHPEIVWSDGDAEAPDMYWKSTEFLAWLYNESPVRETVVVNDRWGKGISCKHGDFYNCVDRFLPGEVLPHKWENAMTIDKRSWGYRRNSRLKDYFTTHQLLVTMAKTISYGGNILMNVGPTSDGRIMPIFEERLLDIGEWLSINGDGIYGTKPWTYQKEKYINVWYTAKGLSVYAIVTFWPNGNLLELKMVKHLFENEATVVTLLGNSEKLKWDKSGDSVKFYFPDKATLVRSVRKTMSEDDDLDWSVTDLSFSHSLFGFSDWKNIGPCLESHENSSKKKKSLLIWLTRKENKSVIEKELQEQLKNDTEYYHNVLNRVVAVVKNLSVRGLAFNEIFGSPHNGNFMGTLELLAEFDPFMCEHIQQRELRPKPFTSYLSKTVYEQIVEIMGKQVIRRITAEINSDDAKYYSIVVDSTPDLSHND